MGSFPKSSAPSTSCTTATPTAEPVGQSFGNTPPPIFVSAEWTVMNCWVLQRSIAVGLPASPGGSATSISFKSPSAGTIGAVEPDGADTTLAPKLVEY